MNGVKVADETLEIDGIVTVKNVSRVLQKTILWHQAHRDWISCAKCIAIKVDGMTSHFLLVLLFESELHSTISNYYYY